MAFVFANGQEDGDVAVKHHKDRYGEPAGVHDNIEGKVLRGVGEVIKGARRLVAVGDIGT